MEFRSLYAVKTAENIHLHVELAGLVNRVFAFAVDSLIMGLLMGTGLIVISLASITQASPELFKTVGPLGGFVLFFGYHLFQEWLWNGKTVGKALFKIRVVRNNGQPIGFWEAFGRNLFRVIDVYLSGIGLICMMFNRSEKRFGDFVAGTVVINDQPVSKPFRPEAVTPPEAASEGDNISTDSTPSDTPWHRLSAEESELLKAFLQRRTRFFRTPRTLLSQALCQYFSERLHTDLDTEANLEALLPPTTPQ